jgi:hypothetical protein
MKKKILVGIVVVIAILAAGLAFLNNRNRTISPPGSAQLTNGDLSVSVAYNRPSVRGRLIFGTKEEGALQPYGVYWRLGANESTEITFNKDVSFNGNPLKAGTYRVYAIPDANEFEIILNAELGKWGLYEPDHTKDILKTKIPVVRAATPVELHTITLSPVEGGINLNIEWANVKLVIPVK